MVSRANVTLSIDEDLLREARILAAQEGTSVSRLLADRLEELIRRHKSEDLSHGQVYGAPGETCSVYPENRGR